MEGIRPSREFVTFSPVSAAAHQLDGTPRGFIRIEVSGGTGRYDAFLQNIRKTGISGEDFTYGLYFGRFVKASSGPSAMIVPGGVFISKSGGFETGGKFNPVDFLGSSHKFEDFNIVLVFRDFGKNRSDHSNPHVIMTAFRGAKLPDWRDYLDTCLASGKASAADRADDALEDVTDAGQGQHPAKYDYKGLAECLDRNFLRADPFKVRRRDYRWWRIDDPAHLNNVLLECDIRTSVLFNPNLIMAHHMHKYLIAGIYSDRISLRDYFVCGIPGEWNARDKPFGEYCRWVQTEAGRPGKGFMGYWLVYFDLMSGKYLGFQ